MSDKIKPFPVKLSAVQEACQRIVEYNPTMLIAVMQDEEGNISYILPPDVLWSQVVGALEICKHSVLLEAAGIE